MMGRTHGRLASDDPALWDDLYAEDVRRPAGWAGASGKQRCVLFSAAEQETLGQMLSLGRRWTGMSWSRSPVAPTTAAMWESSTSCARGRCEGRAQTMLFLVAQSRSSWE